MLKASKENKNMVSIKELINEGYEIYTLHQELAKQNIYTKKQLKKVPNETLIWNPESTQIYCLPYSRRTPQWFNPEISGKLNQTKKIKYNPEIDFMIMMGFDNSIMINQDIKFYRALHADTQPFLQTHNMWLSTYVFQILLSETFSEKIPSGTLVKDEKTEYLIPRRQKRPLLLSEAKSFGLPTRKSLTLAEWDEEHHCWKTWD